MNMEYRELTQKIIGASMEVHNKIGCGFMERIYHRALELELGWQNIEFKSEHEIWIFYKGVPVGRRRADLLVEDKIVVELKAVSDLEDVHLTQALNYLEAFNLKIGLLINFGSTTLQFKRIHNNKFKADISI